MCTAAEIEQIVKLEINFTIDFGPTAAEIEQIVTLIASIKRIYIFLFTFAINVTICSISAAVGQKSIVTLICLVTICYISAAVRPKSIVTLIFMFTSCSISAALIVTLIFTIRFTIFRRHIPTNLYKLNF